jgi:hypothetical protein
LARRFVWSRFGRPVLGALLLVVLAVLALPVLVVSLPALALGWCKWVCRL